MEDFESKTNDLRQVGVNLIDTGPAPQDFSLEFRKLASRINEAQEGVDKKIEDINSRTSFQLQLINERLSNLETRFSMFDKEFDEYKKEGKGEIANDNIQKKIEIIGKHMADLSSDITKLHPGGLNHSSTNSHASGSPPGGNGNVNVNTNVTTINAGSGSKDLDESPTTQVQTQTHVQPQKVQQAVQQAAQQNLQPAQIQLQRHQTAGGNGTTGTTTTTTAPGVSTTTTVSENIPSVESSNSSASNLFEPITRPPQPSPNIDQIAQLDSVNNSYADNGLIDIHKNWSKAMGIRSPSVGSPFTPKMPFDFPIPINRALSFNRQLDGDGNLSDANAVNASVALMGSSILELTLDPMDMGNQNTLSSISNMGTELTSSTSGQPFKLDASQPESNKRRRSSGSTDSQNTLTIAYNKQQVEYPQYKLEKGARNVQEIWQEYEYGVNGKPPLKQLEIKYNAKWRNYTELRTFVRRKKIYSAIENGKLQGYSEDVVIKELEDSRTYYSNGTVKKRPLSWLYSNIPEKYLRRKAN